MARRDPASRGPEEGPFIYRDSSTGQLLLCLNLKVNGRFFARLTGEIPDSQLPAALTRLFARMGSSLEDMLALSRLFCVRNLRLSLYNKEDFHQELIYFLRENVIKSGFSMIFKDLKKLPLYRRQAEEALSLGKKYNPTQWCYLFSQYQLQHLLSTPYPARDVCCQALFTLMEIDRKKGSDLYQTLKSYLYNQGNATKTSEELFIHRTTLIYRIKAISELTGISLENPDTYLHLLLSCRILEQQDYLL